MRGRIFAEDTQADMDLGWSSRRYLAPQYLALRCRGPSASSVTIRLVLESSIYHGSDFQRWCCQVEKALFLLLQSHAMAVERWQHAIVRGCWGT